MAKITVLTNLIGAHPLPSLGLLYHDVTFQPLDVQLALQQPLPDLVLVDTTLDMVAANNLCLQLMRRSFDRPVMLVVNDSGLAAISTSWGATDIVMSSAGPSEIEARVRLALEPEDTSKFAAQRIRAASLVIDEASYSVKLSGHPLNLTFKEFELLKFLATHPSHVFTRQQLLSEVWGYDYFGGTRTVDVHIRRLRAKLGKSEHLIGTVRNVGYQFVSAEQPEQELQPSEL